MYDPDTYQTIDYLYTTAPDLDLSRYVNMRIIVTGEEGIDQRWQDSPILTIQSIQVISTNAVKHVNLRSPRQRGQRSLTDAPLPRKSSANWPGASRR